jgi:hypothetical protein
VTTGEIVLLVVGILLAQVLLWIPILYWLKRRLLRVAAALIEEVAAAGERVVRGPDPGLYRGGSGGRSRVKGNGVAVLTDRRLVFRKAIGAAVDVPVADIVAVREAKWFLRSYVGKMHVVLTLRDGAEVGFILHEHAAWMDLLGKLAGVHDRRRASD